MNTKSSSALPVSIDLKTWTEYRISYETRLDVRGRPDLKWRTAFDWVDSKMTIDKWLSSKLSLPYRSREDFLNIVLESKTITHGETPWESVTQER